MKNKIIKPGCQQETNPSPFDQRSIPLPLSPLVSNLLSSSKLSLLATIGGWSLSSTLTSTPKLTPASVSASASADDDDDDDNEAKMATRIRILNGVIVPRFVSAKISRTATWSLERSWTTETFLLQNFFFPSLFLLSSSFLPIFIVFDVWGSQTNSSFIRLTIVRTGWNFLSCCFDESFS